MAVLLALSTYGVELNSAIHNLIGWPSGAQERAKTPQSANLEPALQPVALSVDSALPVATAAPAPAQLTLAVADGETLAGVLAEADVPAGDAQAAVEATRRIYDPRRLKAGQFITVNFSAAAGSFRGFEFQTDDEHLVSVDRKGDAFVAFQSIIPLKAETRAARGVIHSNLFESTADAGVPYTVAAAMIRAFSYDVDFQREIQPGDRFEVMYDNKVGQSGSHPGDLLFAQLTLSGKEHAIYGFRRPDGSVDFYGADGKSVRKGLLRTPVDGARLSSGFGMRMHPILGYTRMHKGVDFAVPTGTPIYAAGDGVIEMAGWAGGYGRYVRIRHNSMMETAYGHMSRIAAGSIAGHPVHQGQVIGYVGMTGEATGPHLHYEIIRNGVQVNPAGVAAIPLNTGLQGPDLVAFHHMVDERDRRFAQLVSGSQVAAAPTAAPLAR